MVKQYLLNPDGSFPAGANVDALKAAGVRFVIPTQRHRPAAGMQLAEGEPVQEGDVWRQVWVEVPIPAPVPLTLEQADALRAAAYKEEADPLFFKAERGEATRADWMAKVNEIRERFPKARG